jgi:4-amino-4-deoxy-L-arabinose transferase-like glycosyltransferase
MIKRYYSPKLLFLIILLGAFLVRLYGFHNPLAEWHSWRQVDTASVSREFLANNVDLLHPTYHDLSNVPSGRDNPQGYRFVEFPIYNAFTALFYKYIGIFTLEQWGRLLTVLSSLATIVFIFALVKKYAGEIAALFSSFFFAFLPYSIFYGRTILPDPHMVMSVMGAIYFFDKYLDDKKHKNLLFSASILFTAVGLLIKPFAIFFLLPILVLVWFKFGKSLFRKKDLFLYVILSLSPLVLWRIWMTQFPEGIPQSGWLFNYGNIRFKGAYFYWLFAERIPKLILGYWGIVFVVMGILAISKNIIRKKAHALWVSFLTAALLYLVIIARGNIQHDYYQILILPALCILSGLGAAMLFDPPDEIIDKKISRALLVITIAFTLMFGWYHVRDYYNVNTKVVEAGRTIDQVVPENAKILTLTNGDTTLLYHARKKGWTSYQNELPVLIGKGAEYLVAYDPSPSDVEFFGKQYELVYNKPELLIVKLTK